MGALHALGIPGATNFQPLDGGHDVVVTGGAQHFACGFIHHGKGQACACLLHVQRRLDIVFFLAGFWHTGYAQLPQFSVSRSGSQSAGVPQREWFQPHAMA